ncbi:hypothetical protein JZ751_014637 [Albula glossodonta]|uniref:Uncharacterized protein n=1 Tax=Albula glossodonta TaxID=121402 RepID=A0A8T2MW02_9TELE|nr:hypothetical protein JZ751_014637 [Albula glossodonta]
MDCLVLLDLDLETKFKGGRAGCLPHITATLGAEATLTLSNLPLFQSSYREVTQLGAFVTSPCPCLPMSLNPNALVSEP